MKISIITHQFPPSIGGMQQWNHQMAKAYSKAGHNVNVYHFKLGTVPFSDPLYNYHGINVAPTIDVEKCEKHSYSLGFIVRTGVNFIKLLPMLIKSDIVHVCFGEPVFLKLLVYLTSFFCKFKTVMVSGCVIFRHPYKNFLTRNVMFGLSRMFLRKSSIILVDGVDIKNEIREQKIASVPIRVCYAGIDCTIFSPINKEADLSSFALQRNLPIPQKLPSVLFCARFSYENDPLAFVTVVRSIPGIAPIMIGDGPLMQNVREAIKTSVEPICLWGSLPYELLPKVFGAASVCCYPYSKYIGGISQVIPLSMACGAVVITTSIGDNGALIKNGENGFLVNEGETIKMQEKIRSLLFGEDKEKVGDIRVRAQKTICDEWSLEKRDAMYGEIVRGL